VRVLDACGEERVAVLGRSFSGPVAIALAVTHPERVSHLVLFGTAARIVAGPGFPEGVPIRLADAVQRLVLAEWGLASQTITSLLLPEVSPAVAARYAEYQRHCASPEVAAALVKALVGMDVTDRLTAVGVPTLVLHRRDDRMVHLAGGRLLAESIPGARLRVLDGSENLPYFGDSDSIVAEIGAFLNPATAQVSRRELEVLNALALGLSNRGIAETLGIAEATVARHLANLFVKLDVGTRAAAVIAGRSTGLLAY
jgi:pimeloyl-ACP methyl ester carboxylesterase